MAVQAERGVRRAQDDCSKDLKNKAMTSGVVA